MARLYLQSKSHDSLPSLSLYPPSTPASAISPITPELLPSIVTLSTDCQALPDYYKPIILHPELLLLTANSSIPNHPKPS